MGDMSQWTFSSEWAWLLFLVVPVVAFGAFFWQRRNAGSFTFGNTLIVREVKTDFLGTIWWLPGLLRVLAVCAVIVALARPQKPNRKVISTRGVDVLVALDMSASM
ncbi:MAG: Ca-activated chloride channel family protein, partial [Myxococcota bacterium]